MNDVNVFLKNKLRADLPDDFLFTERFGSYMVNFTMKDLREWMTEYVNIETAKRLVAELYEECPLGGYGHIVFDDYNVEDWIIDWCISEAEKGGYDFISEKGRELSLIALRQFKLLTEDERLFVLGVDPDDAADQDWEFTP